MRKKRMALALLAPLLLGGCGGTGSVYSNFREIEDLQLVQTLGYDRQEDEVTVSISSGPAKEDLPTTLLLGRGENITKATEALQDYSSREDLFFAHIQYVLVGEEAARQGLSDLLDWFERNPQTRLDIPLFVVRDDTAEALVTGSEDEEYEITNALRSLERNTERYGVSHCFTLSDIARHSAQHGYALCCSVVCADTTQHVPSSSNGQVALDAGYAVFKDGKLLTLLDRELSRGVSLLLEKAGSLTLSLGDGQGGTVAVMLDENKVSLDARFAEDGTPELTVKLHAHAGVLEMENDCADNLVPALNAAFTQWLKQQAQAVLMLSRELKADFLGLGHALERRDAARFAALEEDWLSTLRCTIEAQGVVERSYDLASPGSKGGEGLG